jgi:peptide-methionine (S)-S-oxide reductase
MQCNNLPALHEPLRHRQMTKERGRDLSERPSRKPIAPVTTFLAATLITLSSTVPGHASAAGKTENAILAGGCFWGVEAVYEHVKGVKRVVSGYAGGIRSGLDRATGPAGYAEAVRISFDPEQISYEQLLLIFFTIAHDPTQVDRQGPDIGPRYRSAIFPQSAQQRETARRVLKQLRASGRNSRPIATRLESGGFTLAEPAHQDYVRKHPKSRYVITNDLPKLAKLRQTRFWRD